MMRSRVEVRHGCSSHDAKLIAAESFDDTFINSPDYEGADWINSVIKSELNRFNTELYYIREYYTEFSADNSLKVIDYGSHSEFFYVIYNLIDIE